MTSGEVFCIFMVGTGAILLVVVLLSLAKRRMTEPFCLAWGFFALLLLLAGFLLHPTELDRYISVTGMLLILFLTYSILVSAYALSRALSVLIRKNRELAVQVSILNAETARLSGELDILAGRMAAVDKESGAGEAGSGAEGTEEVRTGEAGPEAEGTEEVRTGEADTEEAGPGTGVGGAEKDASGESRLKKSAADADGARADGI